MYTEEEFLKKIIQIKSVSKKQNNALRRSQIQEYFEELNDTQYKLVTDFLEAEKIKLIEDDEDLSDYMETTLEDSLLEAEALESEALETEEEDVQESALLKMYMDELKEISSDDREIRTECIREIIEGKRKSEDAVMHFLSDVIDIARLYDGQGVLREDLIGEGNIALVVAVKMIECCETVEEAEELVTKNIMDAMESIIMEGTKDNGLDVKVLERVNDINEKAKEMYDSLLRKVTAEEIAKEYELDLEEVMESIRLSGKAIEYVDYTNTDLK